MVYQPPESQINSPATTAIAANALPNWEVMQRKKPIIGVEVTNNYRGSRTNRLLAFVNAVELQSDNAHDPAEHLILIDLRLPERLKQRQKIAVQ